MPHADRARRDGAAPDDAPPDDAPPDDAPPCAPPAPPSPPCLSWATVLSRPPRLGVFWRAAVPGGWLVRAAEGAIVYVPDPAHVWGAP